MSKQNCEGFYWTYWASNLPKAMASKAKEAASYWWGSKRKKQRSKHSNRVRLTLTWGWLCQPGGHNKMRGQIGWTGSRLIPDRLEWASCFLRFFPCSFFSVAAAKAASGQTGGDVCECMLTNVRMITAVQALYIWSICSDRVLCKLYCICDNTE